MRQRTLFNEGWLFTKQAPQQNDWQAVTLPHTWNAIDGANGFAYDRGAYTYRNTFIISQLEQRNRQFIEFGAVNAVANVYLNGVHLGEHRGGYSMFRFELTDHLHYGTLNTLEVIVDNTALTDVYPQTADFTFFGGIYRDVHLVSVHPIHFDLMDYGSTGIYIDQHDVTEQKADLTVRARLANQFENAGKVRVWVSISKDGFPVTYAAQEVTLEGGEVKEVALPIRIMEPSRWDGPHDPQLYVAHVSLTRFNDTVDEINIPFGVRAFEVDPDEGFILNGRPLRLNGVSRHQDRKDKGWAISRQDHEEDMALVKEVGATSIRLAHYQHDGYFYDLCDREGMIVWAEIPFISVMSKTDLEGVNAKQQMIELIRQNYNHPSIIFWGVQNEIQIGGERPEVRRVVAELEALTKREDPSRLTTMANVMFVPDHDTYNRMTDVLGYNKYYGWYQGKVEDFAPWIDKFHAKNPDVCLGISEYGAEGIIEYHTDVPQVNDYSEEYHTLYHETVWKIFEARPFLWSTYVWNMFDFGANIRDEGGVKGRNNKGLVTYDRKVKKDAFYMYKAHWSTEPFVHITSKRYIDRSTDGFTLKVYSNCQDVTLYVDGEHIETVTSDDRVFTFDVTFAQHVMQVEVVTDQGQRDVAFFNRVAVPNPSYQVPEGEGKGLSVANWFDMPTDYDDIEMEELSITDDVYSTKTSLGELLQNEETTRVLRNVLGDKLSADDPMFSMMEGMTLEMLATLAEDTLTDRVLYVLNKQLTLISK